ncbi:unnamed protein product [Urochloa humidicola]
MRPCSRSTLHGGARALVGAHVELQQQEPRVALEAAHGAARPRRGHEPTTAHPAAAKARAIAFLMPPSEHPVTSTTGRDRSRSSPLGAAICCSGPRSAGGLPGA